MDRISKSIAKQIVLLTGSHGKRIYLIGTAHVSQKSCESVQELMDTIKPSVVFLELCYRREAVLTTDDSTGNNPKSSIMDDIRRLKSGELNMFSLVYSHLLREIAKDLEVVPGAEFKTAYQAALKHNSIVILGDRPVDITLKRIWQGMSLWKRSKLMSNLLFGSWSSSDRDSDQSTAEFKSTIDNITESPDLLTQEIQKMGEEFPWLAESIINERDQFMVLKLREVIHSCDTYMKR